MLRERLRENGAEREIGGKCAERERLGEHCAEREIVGTLG
jgi:hypothetical protein